MNSVMNVVFIFMSFVVIQHLALAVDDAQGFFKNWSDDSGLSDLNTDQRNYGVAIADVDFDGENEIIIAGYSGSNFVLKWNKALRKLENIAVAGSPYEALADPIGQAIGVCACDIDGDGKEEIYFLNTNQAYAGRSSYSDVLLGFRDGKYVDLYSDPWNTDVPSKDYAGRSVSCIDRVGSGRYGILIATYSQQSTGAFSLVEMDVNDPRNNIQSGNIVLKDVSTEAGIKRSTGGRAVTVGPIINSEGRSDIYFHNEGNYGMGNRGENYLFKNLGDGTFQDVAAQYSVQDAFNNGRGIALADLNHDGLTDMVLGNWNGINRIFLQGRNSAGQRRFTDIAPSNFSQPALVRNVLVADFDNDINLEIFVNNINSYNSIQPNRLFSVKANTEDDSVSIQSMPVGDALEPYDHGTGAAYVDIDNDGKLELVTSHGESNSQPIEIYKAQSHANYNWLRVMVKTQYGAPARGAWVQITTNSGDTQMRVIDGGSGYLCQMEPVAHFGLKDEYAVSIHVKWPDTKSIHKRLDRSQINRQIEISHPSSTENRQLPNVNEVASNNADANRCTRERFRSTYVDPRTGCRSRYAVTQRRCAGTCSGRSSCCKATRKRARRVSLECDDGRRYTTRISIALSCACYDC